LEQSQEAVPRLTYTFGPFLLDTGEYRLVRDCRDLRLPPKVFETLLFLVERNGLLVEKDDLMKTLWPGAFVEEVTLAQNISVLRKALGDPPGQGQSQYIETVSKRGYRFIADVRKIDPSAAPSGEPQQVQPQSVAPSVPKKWWQNRAAPITLAGLVLLLTGIGAFWRFKALRSSSIEIRSLAVLPLANLSDDPDQEYFADGMTDELITDLAQIHSLRVISRTSIMQFKHTKKTLPEIARELNVDAIVEGSVSRSGSNVHVTAQLLNARQDRHLWAASFERQMVDILGLQTQMAKAIADQVKATLTPEEDAHLTKRPLRNPQAYDALLKGRFLRNRRSAPTTEKAIAYFQQAIAIDPDNAEAWAALGDSYASLGSDIGTSDPAAMRPRAHAAIAKALELDPDLSEAHATSGRLKLWYDWDWAGAEREFRRAIELNPNDSAAHRYYSHYLQLRKRFDEALEENRRALDLAPLDILSSAHLAWLYCDEGLADKTIEQSRHVLEMDSAMTGVYGFIGCGYELKGQWSEAIAAYEHEKDGYKQSYFSNLAHAFAASGNRHQAETAFTELTEFSSHNYVSPISFAEYYAALGDRDKAFQWLERAYREHTTEMISLNVNHRFATLKSDPQFQDLLKRVGF
jgi:TolB-like protein/DNA-binding winged helix-turn-helix (wHTH) protein/Tfp pilus assembly protein PilF